MEHICNICGQEFENHSLKANHIRWKHKDQSDYIKNISEDKKRRDIIKLGDFKEFQVICSNCGIGFTVEERELKFPSKKKYFCCISCANSHVINHSEETRKKLSQSTKELWKNPEYAKVRLDNRKFSSKGEREIRQFLKEKYGDKEVSSHRIIEFDGIKKAVDLTINSKNVIIEYDGVWHFSKDIYEKFGTPEKFDQMTNKDLMVKNYCKLNSINLLRIKDEYYQHNRRKTLVEIINFIESNIAYQELYEF